MLSDLYIKDGLAAMWDGEWNVGFGQRDTTVAKMVDLSENGYDFEWNYNAVGWEWGDKYLQVYYTGGNVITLCSLNKTVNAVTAQAVMAFNWRSTSVVGNYQNPIITFGNQIAGRGGQTGSQLGVAINYIKGTRAYYHKPSVLINRPNNWAYARVAAFGDSSSKANVIVNGVASTQDADGNGASTLSTTGLRRCRYADVRIYRYAVYDRVLSTDEILYNDAIDRVRFGF